MKKLVNYSQPSSKPNYTLYMVLYKTLHYLNNSCKCHTHGSGDTRYRMPTPVYLLIKGQTLLQQERFELEYGIRTSNLRNTHLLRNQTRFKQTIL